MQLISPAATAGFSNAPAYEAHRPSYPSASVTSLLGNLDLVGRRGARIVEVAAGTGKFTALLAGREEGYEVVAVEPLEGMRRELVAKGLRGVRALEGVAGGMDLGRGWGDGCVVAQGFHWFANEEALREIHRVIKPGASLGMIWNIENYNKPTFWPASTKWEQHLNELIHTLKPDGQPRFREDRWREIFSHQTSQGEGKGKDLFSTPLGEESFHWTVWLSEDALWKRLSTLSQVAVLEGKDREDFEGRFRKILKEAKEGGDAERNEEGEVAIHGVTFCAWTKRLD